MKILIRTDAGIQIGNGHIIRMLALANELESRNLDFAFALKQDDFWVSQLKNRGYHTIQLSDNEDDLLQIVQREEITHLIYDTRNDLTVEKVKSLKEKTGIKIIVIDSPEETRLAADVNIYPPIPQVSEWQWNNFKGKNLSGWEYVLLRKEISLASVVEKKSKRILLSFGSTDPFLLTEWALQEIMLNSNLFTGYEFILVVGPQFNRLDAVKQLPGFENLNISIIQSPKSIEEIFLSVDFAFIALGVTAYELAALSVPFLFVSISDDHAKSGEVFAANGLGYPLGIINKSLDNFGEKVGQFMNQKETVKENLKKFGTLNKICDWPKIINAITH